MEETYVALDSSPSRPQKDEHLSSGSPLPLYLVPPPGPTAGESGSARGGNEVNLKSHPLLFIKVLGSRRVIEVDFDIIAKFSPKT